LYFNLPSITVTATGIETNTNWKS